MPARAAGALLAHMITTRFPGPGSRIIAENLRYGGGMAEGDVLTTGLVVLDIDHKAGVARLACRVTGPGGMVLALMTLPTIIIATRSALKAVPPSIREAALAMGASKTQTVFSHVLPLAMPGMLTGTILAMAHALGETAPLLMIGMVAFVVDIPTSPLQAATVLPVQIFMWADHPERGFVEKTSAAIIVLLAVLLAMNAVAIYLRKKFERKW